MRGAGHVAAQRVVTQVDREPGDDLTDPAEPRPSGDRPPRGDGTGGAGHASRRRTKNVAVAREMTVSSPPRTFDSRYATLVESRTTSPRTLSVSPLLLGRIVWYATSRVAARSPRSRALLAAKFIAASWTTPYTPPWTAPSGLHASAVGVQVASAQPSP